MLKTTNKYSGLVIALSLMVGLSGCPDWDQNNAEPNQTIDKKATIQGGVFDATTGARLGGDDLKLTLIQGTSHRSPSVLIKDTNNPLMGEYAFSDVPVNIDAGNITFKMVITNTGYQRFEGLVTFNVAEGELGGTTDTVINLVRDIYLFPTGATAPDIEVAVEYDQEPVIGAIVILQQNAVANVTIAENSAASGTRLVATTGMLPTLTATTDSAGKVTFSGANLVLGGAYTPVVLPIKHEGVQLSRLILAQIIAGNPTINPIFANMLDTSPDTQDDGIFVVFSSNRDADDITGLTNPGRLTLVFNRAVALTATTASPFTATLQNGAAVLTNSGASGSVTATLSADGLTLILDPVFSTAPVATDLNLQVTYAGGALTVAGDEGDVAIAVFNLDYLDDTTIVAVVNIVGP